jgi:hypothetical protein
MFLASLAVFCVAVTVVSHQASADEAGQAEVQAAIDADLAAHPDGAQISPYEVAYHGGNIVVSYPYPGEAYAPVASEAALRAPDIGVEAAAEIGMNSGPHTQGSGDITPTAFHGCPTKVWERDYYCLYRDGYWKGRRVQFNLKHCGRDKINLANYGFENQASSWANGGRFNIEIEDVRGALLWKEPPRTASAVIPAGTNDRAWWEEAC